MKLRLSSFERARADIKQINNDRAMHVWTKKCEGCLHAKNRTEEWEKTILVKWLERMRDCIAANGRYFEKVTNSLNADDEDDDDSYSGDERHIYCIPTVL